MKADVIEIVDRGRGPQLSSCRITVQDVVPYYLQNWTCEQIRDIMPVLSGEEIQIVEQYIREHHESVMEQHRRIVERSAARKPAPDIEQSERQARLTRLEAARDQIRQSHQERNGDSASG